MSRCVQTFDFYCILTENIEHYFLLYTKDLGKSCRGEEKNVPIWKLEKNVAHNMFLFLKVALMQEKVGEVPVLENE